MGGSNAGRSAPLVLLVLAAVGGAGCDGGGGPGGVSDAGGALVGAADVAPGAVDAWRAPATVEEAYAGELVSFEAGAGGGFGKAHLPDVVLGPPKGAGRDAQSLDVVSLGAGGVIVLGFGDRVVVDGPGPDLVVFENAFFAAGDAEHPFSELAEVAVSEDGEDWVSWPCDAEAAGPPWPGCAGWRPVLAYDPEAVLPPDVASTGGDPFDLADIGVKEARFVRITDRTTVTVAPSAGFDLDAVAVLHLKP